MTTEHKTDEVFKTEIIPAEAKSAETKPEDTETQQVRQTELQPDKSELVDVKPRKRMNLLWMSQLLS